MLRRQRQARFGLPFATHVVSRQHGVKRTETSASAHIAGQPVGEAGPIGRRIVKKAAAQKQIAGRADRGASASVAHQGAVGIIQVQTVGVNCARTHQAEIGIGGQVAARGGKQLARPFDFIGVLRHMRRNPDPGVFGRQRTGPAQLGR